MVKDEVLEQEVDNDPITQDADDTNDKKIPILEEIKQAVAEYREITDYSKSDYIIREDIGWHLLFGDIGRHAINKTN